MKVKSYAVWNNKGGVGKSFLTFVMAAEYATLNNDAHVFVIDMCPQANVSEILLGGDGAGSKQLDILLSNNPRTTVGGYFDTRISQPHSKTGNETSFVTQLNSLNTNLPSNLFLVAGDPSLELQAQAINQIATQSLPVGSWKNVHSWLRDLVEELAANWENSVFFIDCNPSFSAYKELAILAANRMIIPCTADGSSARAIDNVGQLVYGINVPTSYATADFEAKASTAGMTLPLIHIVTLNRSTQYDKKASKAFEAMFTEIKNRVINLHKVKPNMFSSSPASKNFFFDVPDAHSVSVVVSHHGMPLRKVKVRGYNVHGTNTKVNKDPLNRYNQSLSLIMPRI